MGEANHNPRSQQYTGPLPEFEIQSTLGHRLVPTPEWHEANKEEIAAGTATMPRPEDCTLEIIVAAGLIYPSRLTDPNHWKRGIVGVGVLGSIPFVTLKAAVDAQIASAMPPKGE